MKRFNLKIILFNTVLVLLFILIIFLENLYLNKSSYFKLPEQTNYIVLGHSHPECAFNDSLISNLRNFSYSAEPYFYTYFKTKKLIENNGQLKAVFIEFTNNSIMEEWDTRWTWDNENLQDLFPKYIPFMNLSDVGFLLSHNNLGVLSNLPKILVNNLGEIFNHLLSSPEMNTHGRFGGFLYLPYTRVDSLLAHPDKKKEVNLELASTNLLYLSRIIDLCRINNIEVFLIRSPIHSQWPDLSVESEYKKILKNRFSNVNFLDFKNFPLNNSDFGDLGHLNGKGARKFSIFFNHLLSSGFMHNDNKQMFIDKEFRRIADSDVNNTEQSISLIKN